MLCIHNNSLMLNHIFAFTLPEIQDVPKKGTFPDFDVPFPLSPHGSPFGGPGPHGDLFQFLGPHWVPISVLRSPFSLFRA